MPNIYDVNHPIVTAVINFYKETYARLRSSADQDASKYAAIKLDQLLSNLYNLQGLPAHNQEYEADIAKELQRAKQRKRTKQSLSAWDNLLILVDKEFKKDMQEGTQHTTGSLNYSRGLVSYYTGSNQNDYETGLGRELRAPTFIPINAPVADIKVFTQTLINSTQMKQVRDAPKAMYAQEADNLEEQYEHFDERLPAHLKDIWSNLKTHWNQTLLSSEATLLHLPLENHQYIDEASENAENSNILQALQQLEITPTLESYAHLVRAENGEKYIVVLTHIRSAIIPAARNERHIFADVPWNRMLSVYSINEEPGITPIYNEFGDKSLYQLVIERKPQAWLEKNIAYLHNSLRFANNYELRQRNLIDYMEKQVDDHFEVSSLDALASHLLAENKFTQVLATPSASLLYWLASQPRNLGDAGERGIQIIRELIRLKIPGVLNVLTDPEALFSQVRFEDDALRANTSLFWVLTSSLDGIALLQQLFNDYPALYADMPLTALTMLPEQAADFRDSSALHNLAKLGNVGNSQAENSFLLSILQQKPELAEQIDFNFLCRRQQPYDNSTTLDYLTSTTAGIRTLLALRDNNPNFFVGLNKSSGKVLCREPSAGVKSPFSRLAQTREGCEFLSQIYKMYPAALSQIPAATLNTMYPLSGKDLAKKRSFSASRTLGAGLKLQDTSKVDSTAYQLAKNMPTLLLDILEAQAEKPETFLTQEVLYTLRADHDLDGFASLFFRMVSSEDNSEAFSNYLPALTINDEVRTTLNMAPNDDELSALFYTLYYGVSEDEEGNTSYRKFLKDNGLILNEVTKDNIGIKVSKDGSELDNMSLFFLLCAEYKLHLFLALKQDKKLLAKLTGETLYGFVKSNPRYVKSAFYQLTRDPFGIEILKLVFEARPDLVNSINPDNMSASVLFNLLDTPTGKELLLKYPALLKKVGSQVLSSFVNVPSNEDEGAFLMPLIFLLCVDLDDRAPETVAHKIFKLLLSTNPDAFKGIQMGLLTKPLPQNFSRIRKVFKETQDGPQVKEWQSAMDWAGNCSPLMALLMNGKINLFYELIALMQRFAKEALLERGVSESDITNQVLQNAVSQGLQPQYYFVQLTEHATRWQNASLVTALAANGPEGLRYLDKLFLEEAVASSGKPQRQASATLNTMRSRDLWTQAPAPGNFEQEKDKEHILSVAHYLVRTAKGKELLLAMLKARSRLAALPSPIVLISIPKDAKSCLLDDLLKDKLGQEILDRVLGKITPENLWSMPQGLRSVAQHLAQSARGRELLLSHLKRNPNLVQIPAEDVVEIADIFSPVEGKKANFAAALFEDSKNGYPILGLLGDNEQNWQRLEQARATYYEYKMGRRTITLGTFITNYIKKQGAQMQGLSEKDAKKLDKKAGHDHTKKANGKASAGSSSSRASSVASNKSSASKDKGKAPASSNSSRTSSVASSHGKSKASAGSSSSSSRSSAASASSHTSQKGKGKAKPIQFTREESSSHTVILRGDADLENYFNELQDTPTPEHKADLDWLVKGEASSSQHSSNSDKGSNSESGSEQGEQVYYVVEEFVEVVPSTGANLADALDSDEEQEMLRKNEDQKMLLSDEESAAEESDDEKSDAKSEQSESGESVAEKAEDEESDEEESDTEESEAQAKDQPKIAKKDTPQSEAMKRFGSSALGNGSGSRTPPPDGNGKASGYGHNRSASR